MIVAIMATSVMASTVIAMLAASVMVSAVLAAGCGSCASYRDRASESEICRDGSRGLTHAALHRCIGPTVFPLHAVGTAQPPLPPVKLATTAPTKVTRG